MKKAQLAGHRVVRAPLLLIRNVLSARCLLAVTPLESHSTATDLAGSAQGRPRC
jgi:hypothetical protein